MAKSSGSSRVLAKLKASVEAEKYYEAHQMYRTLYFRYVSQKKFTEILELLFDGSLTFLKADQQTSGADLANLYLDVLTKSECVTEEAHFQKIAKLLSLMHPDLNERSTFLVNAVKWSALSTDGRSGHPRLHQLIAQVLWKEKNYAGARSHFLHCSDGNQLANLIVEYHMECGYPSEVDLFITQTVLQYLCLQNKATAVVVFTSYTSKHPNLVPKGPPYFLPLLNFLWFLFQAIESKKLAVFRILCDSYQVALNRDPSYRDYLEKIGHIFFWRSSQETTARSVGQSSSIVLWRNGERFRFRYR